MNIEVSNLSKSYGKKEVLNNFNATFSEGKVTAIMGESGCGKTTLLNLLLSLQKADSGTIEGVSESRAVVFQEDRLCEEFSAITNIKMCAADDVTVEEILEHLKRVGLEEVKDEPVSQLSGGMKRRVAIVRAILAKSEFLVLDEPLKALDADNMQNMMTYLKENIDLKTVIMVTHNIEEADFLQAHIINM